MISDQDLLKCELQAHGIKDEPECLSSCENEIKELKRDLWFLWREMRCICQKMMIEPSINTSSSLNNILFLNNVKRAALFSSVFDDLKDSTSAIRKIFDIDISKIDPWFIDSFNDLYFSIRALHIKVMSETYKLDLIRKSSKNLGECPQKMASVAGPWGQLDLPLEERQFLWEGEQEEYMENRSQSKKQQMRYNPEYSQNYGIYYSFTDENRHPYLLTDYDTESPYPHRNTMRFP